MDVNIFNKKVVILKDKAKKSFVKMLSNSDNLINVKIITLSELKKKIYFDYEKDAIVYISNKYNVITEVAKVYLESLYNNLDAEGEKIEFLKTLKKDLDDQNLLIYDNMFKNFLKGKDIVLFDLKYEDAFYENIFKELEKTSNIIRVDIEGETSIKEIYPASNKEEEISFVAEEIAKKIINGVDINNIKLANVSDEYKYTIKKIFKMFNIPVNLNEKVSLKGTKLLKTFKENFDKGTTLALEETNKLVKNSQDEKMYKKMIDVINEYAIIDEEYDIKGYLFEDLENASVSKKKLKNAVNIIDFEDDILKDDYIYLINYNLGSIPKIKMDEDYLNDKLKETLGLSPSYEINKRAVLNVQERISKVKNLVVTYSKKDLTKELYISQSYKGELFTEKTIETTYKYSDSYNKILLLKALDEKKKYGTESDEYKFLSNHYSLDYLSYDNSFKGVNKYLFKNYIKEGLNLSYTSIDEYYKCKFRYYLDRILKIDKNEDTFATIIGNVFHKMLELSYQDDFDLEKEYKKEIDNTDYEFNNMEKFFLEILYDEINLIIDTIKEQDKLTSLTRREFEKRIAIKIKDDPIVYFKGFIDKVVYDEIDGKKVCVIVDYKTGNPALNINNTPYGIGMQLPVYIYLLKEDHPDSEIGGFYLQKILNAEVEIEKKRESLKLQGYSNSDIKILSLVDSSYNSSKLIKGMKTTDKGFYAYSKVLSNEEIDKLSDIVKEKVIEAAEDIINANFEINPKSIDGTLVGCEYCKFKDICFRKNEDIVNLEKKDYKEFLGGDKSEVDA